MTTDVKMGEISVHSAGYVLTATGVGSCLVITLWESQLCIGGLAHAMLPSRNPLPLHANRISENTRCAPHDTRYVHTAIDEILKDLILRGAKRENLVAKIIGGANMFATTWTDIGSENVRCAEVKFKDEGIPIIGECVGGSQGRSVEFSIASGVVTVKMKF